METRAPRACERSADHDRFRARGRTCGPRRRRARYWGEPSETMGDRAWPAFRDRHARRAMPFHKAVSCSRSADRDYGAIGHIPERRDGPADLLPPGVDGMAVGAGQLRAGPHEELAEQRGDHASTGFDATATRFVVRVRALHGDVVRPHPLPIHDRLSPGRSRSAPCSPTEQRAPLDAVRSGVPPVSANRALVLTAAQSPPPTSAFSRAGGA